MKYNFRYFRIFHYFCELVRNDISEHIFKISDIEPKISFQTSQIVYRTPKNSPFTLYQKTKSDPCPKL